MSSRVLIAEPDDDLRTTYERYLTRQGFSVVTAGTLAEWTEREAAFAPDAVVSELDFPDGSLDDYLDSVVPPEGAQQPLLFIATRRSQDQASVKVCALGRGYFVKPFPMAALVQAIREALVGLPLVG